ncbi:MAG: AraC family transcriptional regulator ligand-binding domain-containing protein [Xanthobacter sp.]
MRPIFEGLSFGPEDLVCGARIPFSQAMTMMDRAARLAGMPELGLRVGLRNDHHCFGPVGAMMACAPTLGQGLVQYVRLQGGMSQAASSYLLPMGNCVALCFGIYDSQAAGAEQIYALGMGTATNMVRSLSAGAVTPLEVHFSFKPPPNPQLFSALLKTEVRFNQPQTCIVMASSALSTPNSAADAVHYDSLRHALSKALGLSDLSATARLKHVLRPALSMGETSLEAAARHLQMSPRSLNRHLAAEGTSFAHERDRVRFVMASELLAMTELSIGEISAALSYANHSAFVRSFRRWSGVAPSRWRTEHASTHLPHEAEP